MKGTSENGVASAQTLLAWYDKNARELPWRIPPRDAGRADPYHVWLSEIMLQQTTVTAVIPYFRKFLTLWPDVTTLAAAEDPEVMAAWAGLGYYARARNLLKCARRVAGDLGGSFPDTYVGLSKLPGIGPYTAAAISAIAFDRPETVVDGNVERVMARLHAFKVPLPQAKPALTDFAAALTPSTRPGDYAQAVMDLGATICTPKSPSCGICPWQAGCKARALGLQAGLPARTPKTPKPIRLGHIFLAQRPDGAWLLERRPDRGLLGGMLGWPSSDWAETRPDPTPPIAAKWQVLPGEVRHTFTHFHLRLTVHFAQASATVSPPTGFFQTPAEFSPAALPTVMRKAFDLATERANDPLSEPVSEVISPS